MTTTGAVESSFAPPWPGVKETLANTATARDKVPRPNRGKDELTPGGITNAGANHLLLSNFTIAAPMVSPTFM